MLLGLLVATFAATGPLVVGIDETIARRGPKIAAAGLYRDPVRSSHSHARQSERAAASICLHLLVPIPWAGHTWALPFLTALAPSKRYAQRRHRRFKPLTLWARQLIRRRRIADTPRANSWSWGIGPMPPRVARRCARSGDRRRALASGRASVFTRSTPRSPPDRATAPRRGATAHTTDLR